MSFGAILGQMMQDGLAGGGRLQDSLRNLNARSGGGSNDLFGQLQNVLANAQGPGGLGEQARDFLTKGQVGGLSGGQLGGIGAIAGALLGGGKGAVRGGALAVLGTLALNALRQAQAGSGAPAPIGADEVAATVTPENEKLMIRAMIAAAKADGAVDATEMKKIIGRVGEGGVEPSERDFVMTELAAPLDLDALVAEVGSPEQAAQVYAASLMAISVDSDAEKAYLRDLAGRLGLDGPIVAELHQVTGAPVA